jgi:hypothetical protein
MEELEVEWTVGVATHLAQLAHELKTTAASMDGL